MAMELKRICGHNYRPRKYDIGTKNSAKSSYHIREQRVDQQPQFHNFRPLSQLQTVPPYLNYSNQIPYIPHQQNQPHSQIPLSEKSQLDFNKTNDNNPNSNFKKHNNFPNQEMKFNQVPNNCMYPSFFVQPHQAPAEDQMSFFQRRDCAY